jgi:hypothetical protein
MGLINSGVFGGPSWLRDLQHANAKLHRSVHFGEKERLLLTAFYDERLKIRRSAIPKFVMYARACELSEANEWEFAVLQVDQALLNMKTLKFLSETRPSRAGVVSPNDLGQAGTLYTLTADGLEALQELRPPITLRLKAWIAVLPPWFVTTGAIGGGISATWKLVDLFRSWL